MEILDNVTQTVRDDLTLTIQKGSKLSIASACFSIYAFQELKKQLEGVSEVRFIFYFPGIYYGKSAKRKEGVLYSALEQRAKFV